MMPKKLPLTGEEAHKEVIEYLDHYDIDTV
jgi:hypothetical protein